MGYPTDFDTFVIPAPGNFTTNPSLADQLAKAYLAIEALEAAIGLANNAVYAKTANNLSDLVSKPAALNNLGVQNRGVSVDFLGADPSGSESSTTAFQAAVTELGGLIGQGNLLLGIGIYLIDGTVTSQSFGIGIDGPGSSNCVIVKTGGGDALRWWESSWNTGFGLNQPFYAATLKGFRIDGTSANAGASGLHYGDLMNGQFQDIVIQHFNGTNSIGLWMDNVIGWTERMTWIGVEVFDCTTGIMFDVNGGASSGPGFSSFAYAHYRDIKLAMMANQDGICIRNGVLLTGSILDVTGNFFKSSTGTNTGAMLRIVGSSTGPGGQTYSQLDSCVFNFGAETDYINGTGTPHQTIWLDTNFQNRFNCTGTMWFNSDWQPSNFVPGAPGASGTFLYAGHIFGDSNLCCTSFPAFSVIGGTSWGPGLWVNVGGAVTLYTSTGDMFNLGVLGNNVTISTSDVPSQGKRIRVRAQQPASGGPFTITFNSAIKWPGGSHPTASTGANAVDDFELCATVGLPYVGQAFLNVS